MDYIIAIFLTSFPAYFGDVAHLSEVPVCNPQHPVVEKKRFSSEKITIDGLSYIKAPTQWKKKVKNF